VTYESVRDSPSSRGSAFPSEMNHVEPPSVMAPAIISGPQNVEDLVNLEVQNSIVKIGS